MGYTFLYYRYHFIPLLILIVFIVSIVLSWQRSPEHYKEQKIFHLSSLGNWQEGLSYFSVGLVLIGNLMYILAEEILRQRIEQTGYNCKCKEEKESSDVNPEGAGDRNPEGAGDLNSEEAVDVGPKGSGNMESTPMIPVGGSNSVQVPTPGEDESRTGDDGKSPCSCCTKIGNLLCDISCKFPCIYWIGSLVLYLGLVLTGCFQQSFNKPWHLIGVVLIGIGFLLIFLYDLSCAWCKEIDKRCEKSCCHKFARWFQIGLFIVIIVSGLICITTNYLAQNEWDAGKDEELKKLVENGTITEEKCPGKSINDWLKGKDYPIYYPCKSKSLWSKGNPGFGLYRYSAYAEIIMFSAVVVYSFTYSCILEKQKKPLPYYAPKFLQEA